MTTTKKPLTSDDVYALIQGKYGSKRSDIPEWLVFPQVSNGQHTRYADALAVNLWASRGFAIHGLEIKVSRSDWLRELKNPGKADPIAAFCDQWWIVVSDESIVQPGELPDGWGLMYPRSGGLSVKQKAEKREAQPLTKAFVAAILRRAYENSLEHQLERKIQDEIRRGIEERLGPLRKRDIENAQALVDRAERDAAAYKALLDDLNRGLGPTYAISPWAWRRDRAEEIGRLAASAINGVDVIADTSMRAARLATDMERNHANLGRLVDDLRKSVAGAEAAG